MNYYNSYKFKQFYFLVIKLTIIFGASYFIYQKLLHNDALSWAVFKAQLQQYHLLNYQVIFVLLAFTTGNWLLEIFKWQYLVKTRQYISFKKAATQSLSAHAASIITPNKIGEYGAKALYFKQNKKQLMLLNFIGNAMQLAATVSFGIVGFIFLTNTFEIAIPYRKIARILVYFLVFILGLFKISSSRKSYFFGFSAQKFKQSLKIISKKQLLFVFLIAVLRYVIFSSQFYYLLLLFDIDLSFFQSFVLSSSMYLISAMIPMLGLFDFVIKGAIAVWLFEKIGVSPAIILSISTIMWLFNFVFPTLLGFYGVINYSKKQQL